MGSGCRRASRASSTRLGEFFSYVLRRAVLRAYLTIKSDDGLDSLTDDVSARSLTPTTSSSSPSRLSACLRRNLATRSCCDPRYWHRPRMTRSISSSVILCWQARDTRRGSDQSDAIRRQPRTARLSPPEPHVDCISRAVVWIKPSPGASHVRLRSPPARLDGPVTVGSQSWSGRKGRGVVS